MSDTIRTTADLLTALADNTVGAITPQTCRDAILTMQSGIGVLSGLAAEASRPVGGPTQITGYTTEFSSSDVTADAAAGTLTVGTAGIYLLIGKLVLGSNTHYTPAIGITPIRMDISGLSGELSIGISGRMRCVGYGAGFDMQHAGLVSCEAGSVFWMDVYGYSNTYFSHASLVARRVG